jgi:HNH endonuclease
MTSLKERLFSKAHLTPDGHWLWTGGNLSRNGYGRIYIKGKRHMVHLVAYEVFEGRIPKGKVLDHVCRTRLCFRPFHGEKVTMLENTLRGEGPTAKNARKTHCHRGHPLPEKDASGRRRCRECRRRV